MSLNKNNTRSFNTSSNHSSFGKNGGYAKDWHAKSAVKMISAFQEILSLGFSEENWTRASWILLDLSPHCEKRHLDALGDLMAETYVTPSFSKIQKTCESISDQILYAHQQ